MNKSFLIFIICFSVSTYSFSQKKVTKGSKWRIWYPTPIIGYIWQKTNTLDLGISFNTEPPVKHHHNNLNIPFGIDLNWYQKRNYVSPFVGLKYYYAIRRVSGFNISLLYWRTKILGVIDQRLTPEIAISLFGWVNIAYGYNIRIGSGKLDIIGNNRIAIRFFGF